MGHTESVCTYTVFMNLTISIDDRLLAHARAAAQQRGASLQALIREYLRALAGEVSRDAAADELLELLRDQPGRSGGQPFHRDAVYEDRL